MNKKLKIVVSCLSFIMCLFVVISVGSPRKASAHDVYIPSGTDVAWYRPLFPINTSQFNIIDFNNELCVDALPTEFLSGSKFSSSGADTYIYESRNGLIYSEVSLDRENIIISGRDSSDFNIYYGYKDVTWVYSLIPDYIGINNWFLYSERFIIFEEMNEVGYFVIDNHSNYNVTVAYSFAYKLFDDLTSGYITDYRSNEVILSPNTESDLYSGIKSELDATFDFWDTDFVLVDYFYIRFTVEGLSTAQVSSVDLFINYPAFDTSGIYNRTQSILIPNIIIEPGVPPECPPPEVIYETVYVYEIDWFQQITSDIDAFMSIEIIPGISFYDILLICITIPILIAILKVWLGG